MNIAFKHPEFLYFLFAIAIPIIIHLFSFRKYKKIFFHNIHLLKNIEQEQNKTKNKLKQILILCTRILSIIGIVLAFAQPYIPNNVNKAAKASDSIIAIYIDNSFSAQAETKQGILLDVMKKKALQFIEAFPATKKFYLFGNHPFELENSILTKEQIKKQIIAFSVTAHTKQISEIVKKIQSLQTQDKTPISLFLFSDFQTYSSDFENIPKDSLISINILPFETTKTKNLYIDTCWYATPFRVKSQPEKLFVSIQNNSDESYSNIPLQLYVNESLKAISNFSIAPNSKTIVPIEYSINTSGFISVKLSIEDYPILYDNTYFLSYEIASKIPIVSIHNKLPNKFITALFTKNSSISFVNQPVTSIDYTSLSNYSVIILDGLETIPSGLSQILQKNLESGKTVVCIPSEVIDLSSYNSFFTKYSNQKFSELQTTETAVSTIDYNHLLYKNVFDKNTNSIVLPKISKHFPFTPVTNHTIVGMKNKNPLLTHISVKQGSLFVCSSPLSVSSNSFVSHPLFVGLFNVALFTTSNADLQASIGKPYKINKPVITSDEAFHIVNNAQKIDFIPQITTNYSNAYISINPMQNIKESGNYFVTYKKSNIAAISYNYNRNESKQKFITENEIKEKIQDLQFTNTSIISTSNDSVAEQLAEINLGKQLWRYMLMFALLFIALEIAIIRYFK